MNSPLDAASPESIYHSDKPLCVDLDGTLVRTDTFLESILALLARNPFLIFPFVAWLWRGKAYLKSRVARRTAFDPALLPYSTGLLEFLRSERARGRRLVLATASNEQYAQRVAAHLDLFDEIIASNQKDNLAGARKLAALEARFGRKGFAYAGDARVDVPIWCEADHAILVNAAENGSKGNRKSAGRSREFLRIAGARFRALLFAARPHQWLKNVLNLHSSRRGPQAPGHTTRRGDLRGICRIPACAHRLCIS